MSKERCDVLYNQEQWDEAQAEIERLKTAAAIAINLIDDGTPQAAAKSLRRRVFNDGPVPNVYS